MVHVKNNNKKKLMKSDLYQIGTTNDLKIFYCIIRKLYYFHYYYALTIKKKYLLLKKNG